MGFEQYGCVNKDLDACVYAGFFKVKVGVIMYVCLSVQPFLDDTLSFQCIHKEMRWTDFDFYPDIISHCKSW